MSKLLALLGGNKVAGGIYILSFIIVSGSLYSLNGQLSNGYFIMLMASFFALLGLMLALGISANRQYDRLFVAASGLIESYNQGQPPKTDLEADIEVDTLNQDAINFIQSFNQFVSGAILTRDMFSEVSSRLGSEAQNLSSTSSQISQMMEQQLNSTAQVQQTIDQLQEAINLAGEVAASTHDLANKSEREGASGKEVMTEAICGVMTLSESVNSAGEIIQNLGEDSKSIGGIIDVITGVAEQTNLLALNAAIEAARAGEQGRGFAVVADEVRSLASKTQESALKINNIINLLLGHVDDAVNVINNSVEQADKADELMEGVTISYSEIVGLMVEVASYSNKLLESNMNSESSVNEAVVSLNSILESSQNSILKANELNADSMELGKMGDQLSNMIALGKTTSDTEVESEEVELF